MAMGDNVNVDSTASADPAESPLTAANRAAAHRFYTAFSVLDAAAMNAEYASSFTFYDPVFAHLPDWKAQAMWCMLSARSQRRNHVEFKIISVDDEKASV